MKTFRQLCKEHGFDYPPEGNAKSAPHFAEWLDKHYSRFVPDSLPGAQQENGISPALVSDTPAADNGGDVLALRTAQFERITCDCSCVETCPQGKTGLMTRCQIFKRRAPAADNGGDVLALRAAPSEKTVACKHGIRLELTSCYHCEQEKRDNGGSAFEKNAERLWKSRYDLVRTFHVYGFDGERILSQLDDYLNARDNGVK